MATKNRDIVFALKMKNASQAALRQFRGDMQGTAKTAAEASAQLRETAKQAKMLDTAVRKTAGSMTNVAGNINQATAAVKAANAELSKLATTTNRSANIGKNMANAGQSIRAANDGLRALNAALTTFVRTAEKTGALGPRMQAAASGVNQTTVALRAATTQAVAFTRAAQQAGQAVQNIQGGGGRRGGGANGLGMGFAGLVAQLTSIRTMAIGAFASLGALLSGRQVFQYTDTFTALNSQLRLVTKSTQDLSTTYEALFQMAQNTRQSLDGTVNLYARISRATKNLNMSQEETLGLTDAINKSVAIFGGPAASAEAALFQLSQGFAAGQLRGEELNSVLEQAPRLAQAIADGMGVAVGSLRQLAESGQLTSANVLKAIQSQAAVLDEEFMRVGVTVSQGFTVANNAILDYIGRVDQATKTSGTFAASIMDAVKTLRDPAMLSAGVTAMEMFGAVLKAAVSAGLLFAQNLDLIMTGLAGVAAYLAYPAITGAFGIFMGAARGAMAFVAALNLMNVGLMAGVARLKLMQLLLSRTGVGLAVMAIAGGVSLWMSRTTETERATEALAKVVDDLRSKYDDTTSSIEGMTDAQKNAAIVAARNALAVQREALKGQFDRVVVDLSKGMLQFDKPENVSNGVFEELQRIVEVAQDGLRNGTLNVQDFIDRLNAVGAANPELSEMVEHLTGVAEGAAGTQKQIAVAAATIRHLQGAATEADKVLLGLIKTATELSETDITISLNEYASRLRRLQDMNPDDKKLMEQQDGLKAATAAYAQALEQLDYLRSNDLISVGEYNTRLAEQNRLLQAAKDEVYGLTDARKELLKYEREASSSGVFNARARAIQEEKDAYAELVTTLKNATAAERERARVAHQTRLANIDNEARFNIVKSIQSTLQSVADENRMIGLSASARERLAAVIDLENQAREAGIENISEYVDAFTKEYDRMAAVQAQGRVAEMTGESLKEVQRQLGVMEVAADKQDRLNKLIDFEMAAREAGLSDIGKWRDMYVKALDDVEAAQRAVNANFGLGFGEGLREFAKEATNTREQARDLAKNIAGDISGTIKGALKGEGFDLGEMIGNIGGRFIDMAVDNIVGNMAKNLGGMFNDGMSADPAVRAREIVDAQMRAYETATAGIRTEGDTFIANLRSALGSIVDGIAAIDPSSFVNQNAGYNPGDVTREPLPPLGAGSYNFSTRDIAAAANAIRTIESGSAQGNYSATGPAVHRKNGTTDYAHGAYQVMGANVPQWSKAAIGRAVTVNEFRASPEIQDRVFEHRFGGYMRKYGPEGASQAWFGGEGSVGKTGRRDVLGTSIGGYGSRFSNLYAEHGGGSAIGNADAVAVAANAATVANQRVAQAHEVTAQATNNAARSTQAVSAAADTAAVANQRVAGAFEVTRQSTEGVSQSVANMGQAAGQAANNLQTAAATAGQAGQTAGMASTDMQYMSQGISTLLGPLNQVVPGLGSFAQGIIGLISSMSKGPGGGGGGAGPLSFFGSLFGFEKGGIMSAKGGSLPLKAYAKGGIATGPQLALFGEGRMNEAYVPLPDGRSIPVTMRGGEGGGGGGSFSMGDINIQMQGSSGNSEQDRKHAEDTAGQMQAALEDAMGKWFLKESAPGGMVASARKS